jgi:hypothetical protein
MPAALKRAFSPACASEEDAIDNLAHHPLTGAYLLELVMVVYLTRATPRRVARALAGGVAAGAVAMGMIALCEAIGWWSVPLASTPYLLFAGLVISCSPIYLITWRIARRFGWRGLAVFVAVVTVIGPPRDYLIAAKYPEWMAFSPGVLPILADAMADAAIVVVGHAVMRVVAGPAGADRLARSAGPVLNAPTN